MYTIIAQIRKKSIPPPDNRSLSIKKLTPDEIHIKIQTEPITYPSMLSKSIRNISIKLTIKIHAEISNHIKNSGLSVFIKNRSSSSLKKRLMKFIVERVFIKTALRTVYLDS